MKANEFRLNNYVLHNNEVDKIISISSNSVSIKTGIGDFIYSDVRIKNISPIPLTEEWLIKFGFESIYETKDEFRFTDNKEGFRLELSEYFKKDGRAVFYYNKPYKNENHTCIAYCKYVHQLQNLYHALSGNELNETIH